VKYVFHLLVTVATKNKEKKSTGSEVDSDSKEDEDSIFNFEICRYSVFSDLTFPFSFNYFYRTIATKKHDKKRRASDNASDSEEDEDIDEPSLTELEKKPKSKKTTPAKCK
jgi:hypothetical protein